MISAWRRKRGPRASRRFSGSRSTSSGVTCDDLAVGGADITISFCIAFMIPVQSDELGRQPVEQFGVAGPVALRAEVFAGLDDADAEEHLPQAVDGDARGQRVVGLDQPLGQSEAVHRVAVGAAARKRRGTPAVDLFARLVVLAADEDVRSRGLGISSITMTVGIWAS